MAKQQKISPNGEILDEDIIQREENAEKLKNAINEFEKYCSGRGGALAGETKDALNVFGMQVYDKKIDKVTLNFGKIKVWVKVSSKGKLMIAFACADGGVIEF